MTTDNESPQSNGIRTFFKKPIVVIAVIVLVLMLAVYIAMLNHVVLWPSYSSSQLAAAGGWIGGIGSLLAVSVALAASYFTRRDAERHLETQLLAEHRTQQIDALLTMWQSVSDLCLHADQFRTRISELQLGLIDQERLSEEEGPFGRAVRQASVASTRAIVTVDNETISSLVESIVKDTDALALSVFVANDNIGTQHHVDIFAIAEHLDKIDAHRRTLTDTIRQELPNPALTRFMAKTTSTQTDPPTAK
ncbi:hypothetical protein CH278_02630 [Rhodococcus sp. 05-2254-5]|uniref:hypothetical protein n=1 Tax=unclassified Rhodococcus (in: high G+C Gram-positive bacteria) TaxID=192944 RepID=UPI000B9B648A|nr:MULTISPECIES: hypothetical protein [unclassified Rhodococcus (in: high G+C Gram-positive bacteria)]OZE39181.1 hypothetical protein CH278_02630 [Rhodococcus sp. 05-2254-5]OZE59122.1 hypothetical protein CH269_09125 [Rhodococcus sp. 05-2254-1]